MFNKRRREPPPNENDILSGTCQGCKAVVLVLRYQAQPPTQHRATGLHVGTWNDLWTVECVACKARVYLRQLTATEVEQLRQKQNPAEA